MKQLQVAKTCNGCGACIFKSPYFVEDAEGNAVPVAGKAVADKDLAALKRIAEECPQKAIQIVETGSGVKPGKEGLQELLKKLEERKQTLKISKADPVKLKFKAGDYDIPVPFSVKQYSNDYSSESQAKSAARAEFENLCYLPSAYRPLLKKVFVEYKVKKLRPYYTYEEAEGNFYYQFNQSMERFLREIYGQAREAGGAAFKLLESWCRFDVRPGDGDFETKLVKNFDDYSTGSGIIADFKSRGEYTSLRWYVDRMDFDYDEVYVGEGMFGRAKYKNQWHFSGFEAAAKEFVNDLKSSMDSVSDDITDRACDVVNCALGSFERKVKDALAQKAAEFKKYL